MGVPYSHLTKEEIERNRELNKLYQVCLGRGAKKVEEIRKDKLEHAPEPYPYTHPIRTVYGRGK